MYSQSPFCPVRDPVFISATQYKHSALAGKTPVADTAATRLPKNCRHHKSEMKQGPQRGRRSIWCHRTKLSCHGQPASGIRASHFSIIFLHPLNWCLSTILDVPFPLPMAGIAQSVQRLATGWTVRGSKPGGGEIFRIRPDRPWGPPSLPYNGYRVFPGGKAAGTWC